MKNLCTTFLLTVFFCSMVTSAYSMMDYPNGTFFDEHTNLVWLKNANCNGKMTWQQAKAWAAGLKSGSCGLTDNSGSMVLDVSLYLPAANQFSNYLKTFASGISYVPNMLKY